MLLLRNHLFCLWVTNRLQQKPGGSLQSSNVGQTTFPLSSKWSLPPTVKEAKLFSQPALIHRALISSEHMFHMLVGETGHYRKLVSTVTSTCNGMIVQLPFCSDHGWLIPLCLVVALDAGVFHADNSYLWLFCFFFLGEEPQGLTEAWIPIWS